MVHLLNSLLSAPSNARKAVLLCTVWLLALCCDATTTSFLNVEDGVKPVNFDFWFFMTLELIVLSQSIPKMLHNAALLPLEKLIGLVVGISLAILVAFYASHGSYTAVSFVGWQFYVLHHDYVVTGVIYHPFHWVPAPRLVDIETNPGEFYNVTYGLLYTLQKGIERGEIDEDDLVAFCNRHIRYSVMRVIQRHYSHPWFRPFYDWMMAYSSERRKSDPDFSPIVWNENHIWNVPERWLTFGMKIPYGIENNTWDWGISDDSPPPEDIEEVVVTPPLPNYDPIRSVPLDRIRTDRDWVPDLAIEGTVERNPGESVYSYDSDASNDRSVYSYDSDGREVADDIIAYGHRAFAAYIDRDRSAPIELSVDAVRRMRAQRSAEGVLLDILLPNSGSESDSDSDFSTIPPGSPDTQFDLELGEGVPFLESARSSPLPELIDPLPSLEETIRLINFQTRTFHQQMLETWGDSDTDSDSEFDSYITFHPDQIHGADGYLVPCSKVFYMRLFMEGFSDWVVRYIEGVVVYEYDPKPDTPEYSLQLTVVDRNRDENPNLLKFLIIFSKIGTHQWTFYKMPWGPNNSLITCWQLVRDSPEKDFPPPPLWIDGDVEQNPGEVRSHRRRMKENVRFSVIHANQVARKESSKRKSKKSKHRPNVIYKGMGCPIDEWMPDTHHSSWSEAIKYEKIISVPEDIYLGTRKVFSRCKFKTKKAWLALRRVERLRFPLQVPSKASILRDKRAQERVRLRMELQRISNWCIQNRLEFQMWDMPSLPVGLSADSKEFFMSLMSMFSQVVSDIDITVTHEFPLFDTILSRLKEVFCSEQSYKIAIVSIACLVSWLGAVEGSVVSKFVCGGLSIAIKLYFDDTILASLPMLCRWISLSVNKKGSLEFQAPEDFSVPTKLLVALVGGIMAEKALAEDTILKGVAHIKNLPSYANAISFSSDFLFSIMNDVIDYFKGEKKDDLYPMLTELSGELHKLVDEVEKDLYFSHDRMSTLQHLKLQIEHIFFEIPTMKVYAPYKTSASYLIAECNKLLSRFKQHGVSKQSSRQAPVSVLLVGAPGVGKSTFSNLITYGIMADILPPERLKQFMECPDSEVFNVCAEQTYASGFSGQRCFRFDDIFQSPGAAGTPNVELMTFIRLVNTIPYTLHAADIESKGQLVADPLLVIGTTNVTAFDDNSVKAPRAIIRRFDVCVYVAPKKEYTKAGTLTQNLTDRVLDEAKCDKARAGDWRTDFHEFFTWDFERGLPIGEPLSYDTVYDQILTKVRKVRLKHGELLKFHKESVARFVAARCARDNIVFQADDTHPLVEYVYSWFGTLPREKIAEVIASNSRLLMVDEETLKCWRVRAQYLKDFTQAYWNHYFTDSFMSTRKVTSTHNELRSYAAVALAVGSTVTFLYLAWSYFSKDYLDLQSKDEPLAKRSTRQKKRDRQRIARLKAPHHATVFQLQGAASSRNADEIVDSIMYTNQFEVFVEGHESWYGVATFIAGWIGFMPHHFYDKMSEYAEAGEAPILCLTNKGAPMNQWRFLFSEIVWREPWEEQDDGVKSVDLEVIFFKVPPKMPPQKNIIRHFVSEDSSIYEPNQYGLMPKFHGTLWRHTRGGLKGFPVMCVYYGKGDVGYTEIEELYSYNFATVKGDCGSLVVTSDDRDQGHISLVHVAGTGPNGFGVRLFRETVSAVADQWDAISVERVLDADIKFQSDDPDFGGQFTTVCPVKPIRLPTTNPYARSPLFEQWGPSYKSPTVIDDELMYASARSNYGTNNGIFNYELGQQAANAFWYSVVHNSVMDPTEPDELVPFVDLIKGYRSLASWNRKASAGYPWCRYMLNGKKAFFGADGEFDFSSPEAVKFLEDCDRTEQLLRNDVIPEVLVIDLLKGETLPEGKNPRMFFNVSMRHNALVGRYFGAVADWLKKNRVRNGLALGVNPYSTEWASIYHLLRRFLHKLDADYGKFDARLFFGVMEIAMRLLDRYYVHAHPLDNKVRRNLFFATMSSLHMAVTTSIVEGKVLSQAYWYRWYMANLSGWFLTTILNCICNHILIRYSFYDILLEPVCGGALRYTLSVPYPFMSIESQMYVLTFGDDVVLSFDVDGVNQKLLTTSMAQMGMVFTDAMKSDDPKPYHDDVESLTFLKRTFRSMNGHIVAPLELRVILEAPYWTKTSAPHGSVETTVEWTLMELSLHGRDVFNTYAPTILDKTALCLDGYRPFCDNWEGWFNKALHTEAYY